MKPAFVRPSGPIHAKTRSAISCSPGPLITDVMSAPFQRLLSYAAPPLHEPNENGPMMTLVSCRTLEVTMFGCGEPQGTYAFGDQPAGGLLTPRQSDRLLHMDTVTQPLIREFYDSRG